MLYKSSSFPLPLALSSAFGVQLRFATQAFIFHSERTCPVKSVCPSAISFLPLWQSQPRSRAPSPGETWPTRPLPILLRLSSHPLPRRICRRSLAIIQLPTSPTMSPGPTHTDTPQPDHSPIHTTSSMPTTTLPAVAVWTFLVIVVAPAAVCLLSRTMYVLLRILSVYHLDDMILT